MYIRALNCFKIGLHSLQWVHMCVIFQPFCTNKQTDRFFSLVEKVRIQEYTVWADSKQMYLRRERGDIGIGDGGFVREMCAGRKGMSL